MCCNERKYSVAGRAQALDLPPFQGVAGDVGFAVMSDEGIAEVDYTLGLSSLWSLDAQT